MTEPAPPPLLPAAQAAVAGRIAKGPGNESLATQLPVTEGLNAAAPSSEGHASQRPATERRDAQGSGSQAPATERSAAEEPAASRPIFQRLALIGCGLIGSSIARAVRARFLATEIVVCDRDPAHAARITELALADRVETYPARAVQGADCVILCTPVGAYADLATAIAPHLAHGAILSDTGSTKVSVIRDVSPHVPAHAHFVPAHPLAGTEHSGPDAGFETLFKGRWCLLTPPPGTDPDAIQRIDRLWRAMGSMTSTMEPAHHDRVLAIVSHLPHLIAFTICGTADDLADETRQQVLQFAATGFRDFTRIASSDPDMWRDVFLNNREALLEMLARFTEDAQAMARAVRWGDAAYIEDRIGRGRKIRRSLIELKQA